MGNFSASFMDSPACYRIRVRGRLSQTLADAMWGEVIVECELIGEEVKTTVVGEVADQSALMGMVNTLFNMGHAVISVERLEFDESSTGKE
jgi:hypothetical protein